MIPWTTSLVSKFRLHGTSGSIAVALFAANDALARVSMIAVRLYLFSRPDLARPDVAPFPGTLTALRRSSTPRVALVLGAVPLAFLSAAAALVIVAAVAIEALLPPPWARPASTDPQGGGWRRRP